MQEKAYLVQLNEHKHSSVESDNSKLRFHKDQHL